MKDDAGSRLERIRAAVEMRPVDKIPVSINGPAFTARAQGLTIAEFISDFEKAASASIGLMERLETADSLQTPIMWPEALSLQWLSKIRVPGVDLLDDELWQVDEREIVTEDDYETVLEKGFAAFQQEVLTERLGVNLAKLPEFGMAMAAACRRCAEAGFPVINSGGVAAPPFEVFCGGRSMMNFYIDLVSDPELVSRVLKEAYKVIKADYIRTLELDGGHSFGTWVGGWRGAPSMISHDAWREFEWPYMKDLAMITIDRGYVSIFHLDSNWDREFDAFLELPPHKSILALDGSSDIRACRAALGDHSAIMGDVPSTLLAFAKPEEVFRYTTKLIDDVGPTGLIISSGCDIPLNAKFENVKAMVDAAAEYRL